MRKINYIKLEKILKRHFKKNKTFDMYWHNKNCCQILIKNQEDNSFYGYIVFLKGIQNEKDSGIEVEIRKSNQSTIYNGKINNLDILFKLLSHKGILLKDIADKQMVVKRLNGDEK